MGHNNPFSVEVETHWQFCNQLQWTLRAILFTIEIHLIDKSVSCLYGQGGNRITWDFQWIFLLITIQKHCEIQDSCDSIEQIMLHLMLIMDEADERRYWDALQGGMSRAAKAMLAIEPRLHWKIFALGWIGHDHFDQSVITPILQVLKLQRICKTWHGVYWFCSNNVKKVSNDYLDQADMERHGGMH